LTTFMKRCGQDAPSLQKAGEDLTKRERGPMPAPPRRRWPTPTRKPVSIPIHTHL